MGWKGKAGRWAAAASRCARRKDRGAAVDAAGGKRKAGQSVMAAAASTRSDRAGAGCLAWQLGRWVLSGATGWWVASWAQSGSQHPMRHPSGSAAEALSMQAHTCAPSLQPLTATVGCVSSGGRRVSAGQAGRQAKRLVSKAQERAMGAGCCPPGRACQWQGASAPGAGGGSGGGRAAVGRVVSQRLQSRGVEHCTDCSSRGREAAMQGRMTPGRPAAAGAGRAGCARRRRPQAGGRSGWRRRRWAVEHPPAVCRASSLRRALRAHQAAPAAWWLL